MSECEKLHQRIAQLVERNGQLGAELECALGDLATAKTIAERNMNDAERYRLLRVGCENNGSRSDEGGCLWVWDWRGCNYEECGVELSGEELDGAVDSLLAKERT